MKSKFIFKFPFVIFLLSLTFYIALLSPSIDYGDGATFITKAVNFHFEARATSHPLYYLICKLFLLLPFGALAWKINLVSAVSAAASLGVLTSFLEKLKINRGAVLAGVFALGFSHTFWLKSCLPDVYTLQILLGILSFFFLLEWHTAVENDKKSSNYWLIAWAVIWGLSLMHHFLLAFLLPGQIVFLVIKRKNIANVYKFIGIFALSFLITSFIWWYFALMQFLNGENLVGIFTGGGGVESKVGGYSLGHLPKAFIISMLLFAYQFPWLLSLLGIFGAFSSTGKTKAISWMLGTSFIVSSLFAITYKSNHKYEVFLQAYLIFAVWIAFGANSLLQKYPKRKKILYSIFAVSLILQPISYFVSSELIEKHPKLLPISIRTVPYRNNARHFFFPPKLNSDGAERYGREVMAKLPKDSVIIADWTLLTVLLYMQEIKGVRPDVEIIFLEKDSVNEVIAKYPEKPILVADDLPAYKLNDLPKGYHIKNCGIYFKIVKP